MKISVECVGVLGARTTFNTRMAEGDITNRDFILAALADGEEGDIRTVAAAMYLSGAQSRMKVVISGEESPEMCELLTSILPPAALEGLVMIAEERSGSTRENLMRFPLPHADLFITSLSHVPRVRFLSEMVGLRADSVKSAESVILGYPPRQMEKSVLASAISKRLSRQKPRWQEEAQNLHAYSRHLEATLVFAYQAFLKEGSLENLIDVIE